jgi:hypothetical protein
MTKPSAKKRKTENKSRRPISDRKTRVLSGRIMETKVAELKLLYPPHMTESEIINDLVREKLTRAKFDQWMASMKENIELGDIDLESFR